MAWILWLIAGVAGAFAGRVSGEQDGGIRSPALPLGSVGLHCGIAVAGDRGCVGSGSARSETGLVLDAQLPTSMALQGTRATIRAGQAEERAGETQPVGREAARRCREATGPAAGPGKIVGGVVNMEEWYVLRTKPHAERQVDALLALRNCEHYLPLVHGWRSPCQREPLFPGYLFIRTEIPSLKWVEVRSLPGVAYVLNTDGRPVPVPAELVDSVRARVEMENGAHGRGGFNPGDRVWILRGPFQGLEAAFDRRLSPAGRSRVLVHLLSRLVPVEIHDTDLRKAG